MKDEIKQRIRGAVTTKNQITIPYNIRGEQNIDEVVFEERSDDEEGDAIIYFIKNESENKNRNNSR